MPTVTRGSVTIDLPAAWKVQPRRRTASAQPVEEMSSLQVAQAIGENFEQVEVVPIVPASNVEDAAPTTTRRRSLAPAPHAEQAAVRVAVGADENAVLLVEQDGVYTWVHGSVADNPRKTRGIRGRTVSFELDLIPAVDIRRTRTRGFSPKLLLRPLKVVVFKFLAEVAVGQVVKRFERHIDTGLVWIRSTDPEKEWTPLQPSQPGPVLPKSRPARVLLLLHGTFSSTEGGYGHLKATVPGQQFLERAISGYDAVIGFDHRTLSEDPNANADELKSTLESLNRGSGILVEAVTHSRGALVLRSLVEHLLPSGGPIRVSRAVMVAGPNAGTRLASSERWPDLIDLYTNLVVASSKLVALALPQSRLPATLVSTATKGLAAMVKAITTAAVDPSIAPGLAAMDPEGAFIHQINAHQPGQPTPEEIWYAAITTNYEPDVFGGPGRLPKRLAFSIADAAIDRLMMSENDLVVDVPSMTSIDLPQRYFKDVFNVPGGATTYHTTYFNQTSVIQRITAWLSLDTVPGTPTLGPAGTTATALPPEAVEAVVVIDAETPREAADDLVRAENADFAVVRRRRRDGAVHHYQLERSAFDKVLARIEPGQALSKGLGSNRRTADEIAIGAPLRQYLRSSHTKSGAVVMRGDRPVAVVPKPPLRRNANTQAPASRSEPKPPRKPPAKPAKAVSLETRIGAMMPDRVDLDDQDLVLVELSVDELSFAAGAGSAHGVFKPSSDQPITVHAVAKSNASIVGDKRVTVEVPRPGDPRLLQFGVRGERVGPGQVAIIASQGPLVLIRLLLDFTVVEPDEEQVPSKVGAEVISVSRLVERAGSAVKCDQLWIEETKTIGQVNVEGGTQLVTVEIAFDVRYLSEEGLIQERDVTPSIKGDRIAYVSELYQKIEADWGASQGDQDAFHDALRAYGGQLFDELLPPRIQQVLWDNRERIETIQIISDDPYIPWELVHLKRPGGALPRQDLFLAQLGVVRWLDGAGAAPRSFSLRKKSRFVLAPSYPLGSEWELNTATESAFLQDEFGAQEVAPTWAGLRTLLEAPGKFDLLHFAGHGAAPVGNIERAGLVLEVRPDDVEPDLWQPWSVDAAMVEQHANLHASNGNRPIVFLNACQVGRAGYQLTGVGGFGQAFLRAGAGAFVSCLWSVGDELAIAFCRTFYNALRDGKTIAQAAVEARHQARADGDPTWLAYVVYGRPEASVTFR